MPAAIRKEATLVWTGTKTGIRLGLLFSVVGVAMAALTLSIGFKVAVVTEPWLAVLLDVIPLVLFGLAGVMARRRGHHPLIVGLWTGLIYGLVEGLASFAAAVIIPGKATLVRALWTTYLRQRGTSTTPLKSHAQLVALVMHPAFSTLVVNETLDMALFGCIFALLGGMAPRSLRKPAPKS